MGVVSQGRDAELGRLQMRKVADIYVERAKGKLQSLGRGAGGFGVVIFANAILRSPVNKMSVS